MINFLPTTCTTQFGSCPPQYLSARRLTAFPEVKSVQILYRFPFTRQINVRLRTPLGTVGTLDQNSVWVADDTGVIFGQESNSPLPLLILPRDFKLLDQLAPTEIQALIILNNTSSLSTTRLIGQLKESVLTFNLNTVEVYVSVSTSDISWLASLQQLTARSRIDGKLPHKIDLRFRQPILTY